MQRNNGVGWTRTGSSLNRVVRDTNPERLISYSPILPKKLYSMYFTIKLQPLFESKMPI